MSGNYHSHMLVVYGTGFSTLSSILLIFSQLNSHPHIFMVKSENNSPVTWCRSRWRGAAGSWRGSNSWWMGKQKSEGFGGCHWCHVCMILACNEGPRGVDFCNACGLQIIYSLATIQFASSLMVGYLKSQAPNFPLTLCWLVVWNINVIFHFIYGMSSFPLTNSYFSRLLKPPTSLAMTNSMEVRRTSQGRQKGALHDAAAAAERRIVKYGVINPTIFLMWFGYHRIIWDYHLILW